jgi:hypothetical protein
VVAPQLFGMVWYENLGGTLGPEQFLGPAGYPYFETYDVVAADLDDDGDLDLLTSCAHMGVVWLENEGGGVFSPYAPRPVQDALDSFSVDATDLDQDGDLDAVSGTYSDQRVVWLESLRFGDDDGDALASGAETCIVGTDPDEPDTDGGGTDDGQEVDRGSDPLDPGDD